MRHACPCCGYLTLAERERYDICPVCFWEDEYALGLHEGSGANGTTLAQARKNYRNFGACNNDCRPYVRPPSPEEVPTYDHQAWSF